MFENFKKDIDSDAYVVFQRLKQIKHVNLDAETCTNKDVIQ